MDNITSLQIADGKVGAGAEATPGKQVSVHYATLRRVLQDGRRETLTMPMHASIAPGTTRAICRQACRYVPEPELSRFFFSE